MHDLDEVPDTGSRKRRAIEGDAGGVTKGRAALAALTALVAGTTNRKELGVMYMN